LYMDHLNSHAVERILFVNRSTQSLVTLGIQKESLFEYVNLITRYARDSLSSGHVLPRSQALVLGVGGGSVANQLVQNNYQVDAVELDARMVWVAKKYFDLSEKVTVQVDDARHFLRNELQKGQKRKLYNLIVLDAFVGEVNPHHLFTQEFFTQIRSFLSDSGVFFINGNGYWNGLAGKGMRSVCQTLIHAGFNVEVIPTRPEEDFRNLVFVARKSDGKVGVATGLGLAMADSNDAVILTDDKPQFEMLNAEANIRWRKSCMKYFLNGYYSGQDMFFFK
jgi:spermidine synthase